jgi:hypothetical protein
MFRLEGSEENQEGMGFKGGKVFYCIFSSGFGENNVKSKGLLGRCHITIYHFY